MTVAHMHDISCMLHDACLIIQVCGVYTKLPNTEDEPMHISKKTIFFSFLRSPSHDKFPMTNRTVRKVAGWVELQLKLVKCEVSLLICND